MPPRESPIGLALLICDTIIQDTATHKRSLIGLFDRLGATNLPCVHPALSIYASLTSGHGDYPCRVECRHQETGAVAFRIDSMVAMHNPRQIVDIVYQVQGARFPHAGAYWLEFVVDDVPLMMRHLTLDLQSGGPGGPGGAGTPGGPESAPEVEA